jgi:hypothetical protein
MLGPTLRAILSHLLSAPPPEPPGPKLNTFTVATTAEVEEGPSPPAEVKVSMICVYVFGKVVEAILILMVVVVGVLYESRLCLRGSNHIIWVSPLVAEVIHD